MNYSDYMNKFCYIDSMKNILCFITKIDEVDFGYTDAYRVYFITVDGIIGHQFIADDSLDKLVWISSDTIPLKKSKKMIMGIFTRKQNR